MSFCKTSFWISACVCFFYFSTFASISSSNNGILRTISSPDGSVVFNAFVEKGQLMYSINYSDSPVISNSSMGITVGGVNLGQGVTIGEAKVTESNTSYPWRGKHSIAQDHYIGGNIPVTHLKSGVKYNLEARVYNDGVAFRYVVPGESERILSTESTSFVLPEGSTVWYHGLAGMHYEEKHEKYDISTVEAGDWAGPPLTIKLPNNKGYASITESGIIGNSGKTFPGMALEADGKRGFFARLGHEHPANFPFVLRYGEEDHQRLTAPPTLNGTIEAPWRVIMIGKDLNTLFNTDIVHNVAPKPDPKLFPNAFNEEWMEPGRAVWGYLTDEPRTLAGMKNLSRLAGELGFEYHTVEGHWRRWSDEEQKEFVKYSNDLGVKVLYWRHSRDLRDPKERAEFFKHMDNVGVSGAKIDFFDHEAKEIIDLYAACLKEAAEYNLILNFHGANKPAGEVRTWPNEMTREGVFGMEFRGPWAKHNTTIPFTRLLAGHIDYTPLTLGERRAETSDAHQLASALILQSPLLNFAEHPQKLLDHEAVEFIKQIPTVWDETIVLEPSAIGEVAAFARRKDNKWFIAVMNGTEGRTINIDLSFLEEKESDDEEDDYNLMMIRDKRPTEAMVLLVRDRKSFGAREEVIINNTTINSDESLVVEMIPGGGFVAIISENTQ